MDSTIGNYTNIDDGAFLYVRYAGSAGNILDVVNSLSPSIDSLNGLFGSNVNWVRAFPQNKVFDTQYEVRQLTFEGSETINTAIELFLDNNSSGNLTEGDATNYLQVAVNYTKLVPRT
jgi:hypothetical protein